MSIRRAALPFEGQYTQVPNAWLRDPRISRRARGLLAEIMSHQSGWVISVHSLWKNGPEGREAIRKAIVELADAGYLARDQEHGERGRFGEMNYVLVSPELSPATVAQFLGDGTNTGARSTVAQESTTKKTMEEEDHVKGGAEAPAHTPVLVPYCKRHAQDEGYDGACAACQKARIAWQLSLATADQEEQWVPATLRRSRHWRPGLCEAHLQNAETCESCAEDRKRGIA
jgi:hypothetical protein